MRETRARGSSSSSIAIRPEVRVHIVPVSSSSAMSGMRYDVLGMGMLVYGAVHGAMKGDILVVGLG